ncbi:MAG: SUMF1/EgtB/PvdO family nonheme iron enzyme, partial [Candidatus Marinimicrobia bacterium]|nr:SUMF1/EgtB/PvdO family nonheme iron enzyme [Candidatus Neomarinimicrobiota bacterium]
MSVIRKSIVLAGIVFLLIVACQDQPVQTYSTVKYQPAGALQLDPGVFLNVDSMAVLGLDLGDVVDVIIDDLAIQANVYPYSYDSTVIGMNRFMLAKHNLRSGAHKVLVAKASEPTIPVQRLNMHGESYPGDVEQWGHFVISAPHGDCDLFTGEIVQALTKDYGMPTSAFYYPRFTFLGHWFDANRPLGKAPRADGQWTIRERIWSHEIDSVYHSYEDIIRKTAEVEPGQPLDFLCSFHGHDLKMKDTEGKRINREVIEAYGSGFTQNEYRTMISWFNEISKKYFDTTPLLVFGNLPEHQEYVINGQTFGFWYTGLGTRMYGTLQRNNTIRGLHMETPNSMRFDPVDRANTAKLFGEFFTRIHTELLYPLKANLVDSEDHRPDPAVIELPAANFVYRGRTVAIKALKMAATEVTIAEFTSFINDKLGRGDYQVEKELRQVVDTAGNLVCHFDAHHPGDMLNDEKGIFTAVPNRQNYPMTHVSWHAAVSYADYVGGRLPTETEWVRAAGFWDDSLHI